MTIDADQQTLLITDCLVTQSNTRELVTPASLGLYHKTINEPPVTLVSKFSKMEDDSVVGFAGNAAKIQSFFDDFRHQFKLGSGSERPMRWASQLINGFNEGVQSPLDEIAMIGFSIRKSEDGIAKHWVRQESVEVTSTEIGRCAAIGSGADATIRSIVEFDRSYQQDDHAEGTDLRLVSAVGALNQRMLFRSTPEEIRQSWGGYYQVVGHDAASERWFGAPDWVHLAFVVDISESQPKISVVNKVIAYRSGFDTSHLCVATEIDGKNTSVFWRISSGLREAAEEGEAATGFSGFNPRFATALFMVKYGDREWDRYTTINGHHMNSLIFEIDGAGIRRSGLEWDYLHFIADEEMKYARDSPP